MCNILCNVYLYRQNLTHFLHKHTFFYTMKDGKSYTHFYLRQPTQAGNAVYLFATFDGTRATYNTGIKAKPQQWDKAKETVKRGFPQYQQTTAHLTNIQKAANDFINNCLYGVDEFTEKNLKNYINFQLGKSRKDESFEAVAQKFIEYEENKITDTGEKVKKWTVRKYQLTIEKLNDFQRFTNQKLTFKNIDKSILEKYQRFLTLDYISNRGKKGLSVNQISKEISNFKTILKFAQDNGIRINQNVFNFSVPKEKVENVVLYADELLKICRYDFSKNRESENYQIAFLVGCFTGARPSDYMKFKKENFVFSGNEKISITYHAKKTGKPATIPICKELYKLLEKRNFEFPFQNMSDKDLKAKENQMNRKIKEICMYVGLDRQVETKITIGGKRQTRNGKLWEFVTGKTAKRTFVTLLNYGVFGERMSLQEIAEFTGNNLDTIRRYFIDIPELDGEKLVSIFDNMSK